MVEKLSRSPSPLELTDKVNEMSGYLNSLAASQIAVAPIGGMAAANVQEALAETFTSVADGKSLLEAAVTDKGGRVSKEGRTASFRELEQGIRSIPQGAEGGIYPLDPGKVYQETRPADWLSMPEPQDNEMYLLMHIPDGFSSLLAFQVSCEGNYQVETGTVEGGVFVPKTSVKVSGGEVFETELMADDYGDLTTAGMKQAMVKISGTDIQRWEPLAHSQKKSSVTFNVVEITCKLPAATRCKPGGKFANLRYFSMIGKNNITDMSYMFQLSRALVVVLSLDTSKATTLNSLFYGCNCLLAIPQFDTSNATSMNHMFYECMALKEISAMDISRATSMAYMFSYCGSLVTLPALDTSKAANLESIFFACYALLAVPPLNLSSATNINKMVGYCNSLQSLELVPAAWDTPQPINISKCSFSRTALIKLFNSLPVISALQTVTLTDNPGASSLTNSDKALATGKGWTLTI